MAILIFRGKIDKDTYQFYVYTNEYNNNICTQKLEGYVICNIKTGKCHIPESVKKFFINEFEDELKNEFIKRKMTMAQYWTKKDRKDEECEKLAKKKILEEAKELEKNMYSE